MMCRIIFIYFCICAAAAVCVCGTMLITVVVRCCCCRLWLLSSSSATLSTLSLCIHLQCRSLPARIWCTLCVFPWISIYSTHKTCCALEKRYTIIRYYIVFHTKFVVCVVWLRIVFFPTSSSASSACCICSKKIKPTRQRCWRWLCQLFYIARMDYYGCDMAVHLWLSLLCSALKFFWRGSHTREEGDCLWCRTRNYHKCCSLWSYRWSAAFSFSRCLRISFCALATKHIDRCRSALRLTAMQTNRRCIPLNLESQEMTILILNPTQSMCRSPWPERTAPLSAAPECFVNRMKTMLLSRCHMGLASATQT